MSDHYNLYEFLRLDGAASTEGPHANLSNQLSEPWDVGVSEYSGEFQEKLTTLQVLGDERRRRKYDTLLADGNITIAIATLRGLANHPSSAAPVSVSSPAPNQAAQQQSAQPETNADFGAQNETSQSSFQQQSQ